jgi:hypothetical protein
MDIGKYRVPFFVVITVLALLVASPALSRVLVWPRTEFLSEMWILDPNHMAEDYPFNVSSGQSYSVYLGLGNELGYCAYYLVEVKFRNESQSMPSSLGPIENRSPSNVPCLFNMTAFALDQSVWERPVSFGFDYEYKASAGVVEFNSLTLSGSVLDLRGLSAVWNETTSRFYGDLIFELWLYNGSAGNFNYHGRFVDLKLNMTV